MKYLIAVSGPIASGKSVLAEEILKRFKSYKTSTRQLLIDGGALSEREALIEAGNRLDIETDCNWVLERSRRYIDEHQDCDVIIIDAVRKPRQIHHLREAFGEKFFHVHVSVPYPVAKQRYENRDAKDAPSYESVRAEPTENGVWHLDQIADRVVENVNCDMASLLALAVSGLKLFPGEPERLVDVLVGGQYGSEGKGNICAYLAQDYDVLVRVGGPNAGHMVAYPPQMSNCLQERDQIRKPKFSSAPAQRFGRYRY
jgi:adenylosuccinate synthase